MSLKEKVDLTRIPQHIAIIMDGNGRWATKHGKNRIFGHTNGVNAVRETSEGCAELGVKYLTLYAFSTENWSRPMTEVAALMSLLLKTIKAELKTLLKNDIRLKVIGDMSKLPSGVAKELTDAMKSTASNNRMDLILALNYSGKSEIVKAVKEISAKIVKGEMAPSAINEELISNHLYTAGIPDPELLIRTSGEKRVSNFMLWQLAYAEYFFTDVLWPDFTREELYKAIIDFQNRERRFGKTSEQLVTK